MSGLAVFAFAALTACERTSTPFNARADAGRNREAGGVADATAHREGGVSDISDATLRDVRAVDAAAEVVRAPVVDAVEAGSFPVHPMVERLAHLEDDWPLIRAGTMLRSFSSFDRTGGNHDGFDGRYAALRTAEDGTFVIFDAEGPGVLSTLWFTGPREGGTGLDLGTVRFYFDGESVPRIELPWSELFSGNTAPFLSPLVADRTVSTGGFVSWVPIPYARHLTITTERRASFYIAHYETLPADTEIESYADPFPVDPLVTKWTQVLAGDFATDVTPVPNEHQYTGAGTLDVLQVDFGHEPNERELSDARLQIWWDEVPEPSVNVPLGPFFGAGLANAGVRALPFHARNGKLESRFVMPFWSGYRLRVTGANVAVSVRRSPARYPSDEAGYFFATAANESPTTPDVDFQWVVREKVGRLAGTVLTVKPIDPLVKKWWEGDLRSYVGGLRSPSLHGTGHEDDHLGGWSNTFLSNPFSLPLHGEPASEIVESSGQLNANSTMYRFYTNHTFFGGLSHGTEHGNQNSVSANYSGVAFYYAKPDSDLTETDAVNPSDPASRSAHAYTAERELGPDLLTSSFEGRAYQEQVDVSVTYHGARATFALTLDERSTGCFLRRTYDQEQGPQAARILVDQNLVGTWYTAETNETLRLAERDYFLPASVVSGKALATIAVEPMDGYAPWSVVQYHVLCVR